MLARAAGALFLPAPMAGAVMNGAAAAQAAVTAGVAAPFPDPIADWVAMNDDV